MLLKVAFNVWSQTGDENEEDEQKEKVEDEEDELYCIACEKYFASLAAKLNHEASKKHQKALALLREILMEEEKQAYVEDEAERGEVEEDKKKVADFEDESGAEEPSQSEEDSDVKAEQSQEEEKERVEEKQDPVAPEKPVLLSQREKKALIRERRAREMEAAKNGTGIVQTAPSTNEQKNNDVSASVFLLIFFQSL